MFLGSLSWSCWCFKVLCLKLCLLCFSCKDSMPGFKKMFSYPTRFKGAYWNYHVWWILKTNIIRQWLSQSGTKWAVMRLHIVISDLLKEACLSCLFAPRLIEDIVDGRKRWRLKQFKQHLWQHVLMFNTDVLDRTEVTILIDMSGYNSWCPYRIKTLLLIAHTIICRSCIRPPTDFDAKSAKTAKITFLTST